MYLIVFFIKLFPFPPVTSAENADAFASDGKSHGSNAAVNEADTKVAFFIIAMFNIFKNKALGISKGILGIIKGDSMSLHIDTVFVFVPFKFHVLKIIDIHIAVNIKVCDVAG